MTELDWTIYRVAREDGWRDSFVIQSTDLTANDAVKATVARIPELTGITIYDGPYFHWGGLYMRRRPDPDIPLLYISLRFANTAYQFDGGAVLVVERDSGDVVLRR